MRKRDIKEAIERLITTHGRFPKISELATELEISQNQAGQCMRAMVDDGFLIRQGNWYKIAPKDEEPNHQTSLHTVSNSPKEVKPVIISTPVVEEAPEEIQFEEDIMTQFQQVSETISPEAPEEIHPPVFDMEFSTDVDYALRIIQIGMGIIGGGAAIISMYYTSIWLLEILPAVFALIMAFIMVTFSILAFEVVILFLSGRFTSWVRWPIAFCFLCLWLLVGTFNITNTIAGQYNMYSKSQIEHSEKQMSDNPGRVEWQNLQERKKEIQERLKDTTDQIATLRQLYSGMNNIEARTKYGKTWNDTDWKLTQAGKQMDKQSAVLSQIRIEERELIQKYPGIIDSRGDMKTIPDFYGWVSGVLKKDRNIVQFLLSLVPAIFIDIIAPTAIAIGLFLRKKGPAEK